MSKFIYIAIISAFVNNLVLSQTLGLSMVIEGSKKIKTSIRLSLGVLIITVLSSVITWPLNHFVLEKLNITFIQTLGFLLVLVFLVWGMLAVIKKISYTYYEDNKNLFSMIIVNSAVMGVLLTNVQVGYSFLRSALNAGCGAIGFGIAMIIMAGVRDRIQYNDIPRPFEGVPILLVTAGLMSIAFYGFSALI